MRTRIIHIGVIVLLVIYIGGYTLNLLTRMEIFRKTDPIRADMLLDEGKLIIARNEQPIRFTYEDKPTLEVGKIALTPSDIQRFIDEQKHEEEALTAISFFFAILMEFSNPDYPQANYEFLDVISDGLASILSSKQHTMFLDNLIDLLRKEHSYSHLWEAALFVQANMLYGKGKYDKAYKLAHQLFPTWKDYIKYQDMYLRTLWQNAAYDKLESHLSQEDIHEDLKQLYTAKLVNLKRGDAVDGQRKLSRAGIIPVLLLALFLIVLLVYAIHDIFLYFKIFSSYKNKTPDLRRRLYKRALAKDSEEELVCPICGKSNYTEARQRYHSFQICKDDEEILVPMTSCAMCGAPLDEYFNCPVCGFNQKGELAYIFSFDLATSLFYIIYIVSLLGLIVYQFFPTRFPIMVAEFKTFSSSVLIISTILSLLPFMLRDIGVGKKSVLHRFDRFYFVSLNKFLVFWLVWNWFHILSPTDAIYETTQFISVLHAAIIPIGVYGLAKFLTFGQEHKTYYEKHIRRQFKGWLLLIAALPITFFALPKLSLLLEGTVGIYQGLYYSQLLNLFLFFLITSVIIINDKPFRDVKRFFELHIFVQNHVASIINYLLFALLWSYYLIFRWQLSYHYVDWNLYINQVVLLNFYYLIVAKNVKKNGYKTAFAHNFYMALLCGLFLVMFYSGFIPLFGDYANSLTLEGRLRGITYVLSHQMATLLDSANHLTFSSVLPIGLSILSLLLMLFIFTQRIVKLYTFTKGKPPVNVDEALRVNLLLHHTELVSKFINQLHQISSAQRTDLRDFLIEEKYLLETNPSMEESRKSHLAEIIDTASNVAEQTEELRRKFDSYRTSVDLVKQDYYAPVPSESQINNPLLEDELPSDFRFVMIWERTLRDGILKKGEEYLQITEKIWRRSLRLYARGLARLYHQLSMPSYKRQSPYSISQFRYFLVVMSDTPFFPPSLEKLFAMKWHGSKRECALTDSYVILVQFQRSVSPLKPYLNCII